MCKHRSEVFDCWDSLKTTPRSSHPKYKHSEFSIVKPLVPGRENGESHTTDPKDGKKAGRKKKKVFLMLPKCPKSLTLVA